MNRIIIARTGGPEVLQLIRDTIPQPQPDQVLIRVQTAGVAFADVLMREGLYTEMPKPPFTPGYDVVGVVEQIGSAVKSVHAGQTIAALSYLGGYAEYICLPESGVIVVPDGLDAADAVSLVLNYLTAYQMLHRIAHVSSGDRILVHGAAGGVGTALLQLGRLAELEMYGTASQGKHALVRELGAVPIDYRHSDFVAEVHKLAAEGVDVVFDAVGGTQWRRSFETLRPTGKLIAYGFSTATTGGRRSIIKAVMGFLRMPRFAPLRLLDTSKAVMGYNINRLKERHPDWYREDLSMLLRLLAEGRIKPIVAERVPFKDVAHAHELLNNASVSGKIVLVMEH